jgi:cell division protein FtsI/penicillin-binding protein 2
MASESKKWLKIRIGIICIIFLVLFIALISRAFQLQVLSGKKLKTLAQRQHTTVLQLPPERGVIYDRNGEKLAVSIMADSVCADPSKIADPVRAAGQVAGIQKTFAGWPEKFLPSRLLLWKMQTSKEFF